MSLNTILDVIQVIEAVEAIEKAKKRIPGEYAVYSFFSYNDKWLYNLVVTENTCDRCIARAQPFFYRGNSIRSFFPYLEITGVNRIDVHIHPNCNCFLTRLVDEEGT